MVFSTVKRGFAHLCDKRFLLRAPAKIIVVSGADSSHFKSLGQFLESFFRHEKEASRIIIITRPLIQLRGMISSYGFCFALAGSRVRDWVHRRTFDFLGCKDDLWDNQMLVAGLVPVNPRFPGVMPLIRQWRKCALTKECIAPEGSSRENHRQDQAVLTLLAYRSEAKWRRIDALSMGIRLHCDID